MTSYRRSTAVPAVMSGGAGLVKHRAFCPGASLPIPKVRSRCDPIHRSFEVASLVWIVLVATASLQLSACGGGGGTSSGAPPVITSVTVTGAAATKVNVCTGFTANVSGTGDYDPAVNWYVDDVLGGTADTGTITSSGAYCAPSAPPAVNPVTIKAIAQADSTKYGTASTQIIALQISPTLVQLHIGDTQQFSAAEAGAQNGSIAWIVNGTVGGNATVGTISTSGLYTAPPQANNNISVEAAIADVQSINSTASVTVAGKIQISPQNPSVQYDGTQQFTATIIGSNDTSVTWSAQSGTIDSSGLFTADTTQSPDTITARSAHADGSDTVQITAPMPVITGLSPQPATAGQSITVSGQNLPQPVVSVFSDAAGEQIPVSMSGNDDGSSFTVVVPQGSVTGPFFVQTQYAGSTLNSNTVTFQRLARLRIRTPEKDLSAGESVTMQYALMGDSTPQTVMFSADLGSFNGATYQAPGSIASDTFANVTACITGTQSCDTLMLGLHPFRIAPDVPLVGIGQSLQLSAILGGSGTGANWDLLAGGGSLSPSGLYSAGTRVQDGGPAIISATANSETEQTQVGVTGAFPGLLNRIYDYYDQHQQNTTSTTATGLVVVGNRMYAAATNGYIDSYFWIDIYDLTDPLHPAWLTAVEANTTGELHSVGNYLVCYDAFVLPVPEITVYELKNQIPILKGRTPIEPWWTISFHQGVVTLIPLSGNAPPGSAEILLFDATTGTVTARDFDIVLPADANYYLPDTALAVGNRLFVSEEKNDLTGGYILTYDLTTSPPNLLGSVVGGSLAFYSSGNFLFAALSGMDTYDISSQLPQYLSHVDGINAWQLDGTQLLALTGQQGFRLLDMSNPQSPRQTATLFDGVVTGYDLSQLAGNYVYDAAGDAGIAVYDATQTGGPVYKARLYGGGFESSVTFDLLLNSPYLYTATATDGGAALNVYDISNTPPALVDQVVDKSQECYALQSSGDYLYLGLDRDLEVFDATNPSAPFLTGAVTLPVVSLARKGNVLYAGTFDNRLVTLDITNPAQPAILSSSNLGDLPVKIHVFGNLLLVADSTAGLLIYDVSTPASPVLDSTVKGFASTNDAVMDGTMAFVAADVDGLAILDLSNPAQPKLISQTLLSRIEPFDNQTPPNQALSLALFNKQIYVGTYTDNGIVQGYDYTNPITPRLVSDYAHGDFVVTDILAILFNGTDMFVGGDLGGAYPLAQVDMSHPFDSINQYFPPLALQDPGPLNGYSKRARFARKTLPAPALNPRFSKVSSESIRRLPIGPK